MDIFVSASCNGDFDCNDKGEACIGGECVDVCVGACGANTECRAVGQSPECACLPGFGGDPSLGCVDKNTGKTGNYRPGGE